MNAPTLQIQHIPTTITRYIKFPPLDDDDSDPDVISASVSVIDTVLLVEFGVGCCVGSLYGSIMITVSLKIDGDSEGLADGF